MRNKKDDNKNEKCTKGGRNLKGGKIEPRDSCWGKADIKQRRERERKIQVRGKIK